MKDVKESLDLVAAIEAAAIEGNEMPNLELTFEHKESVDRAVMVLDRLEHSAEYFREQSKKFAEVARQLERAKSGVEIGIKEMALERGVTDFLGNAYRFKMARAKPRLVIDEEVLPEAFKSEVFKLVPHKSKIEAALDRGDEVPGAEYAQSYSLRVYVNSAKEIA